jgi:SNF2 family DNA or RNA helicase
MLFVANPAAAGAGLTLHRARIAIYESLSGQAAHFLQSLDRIHRRGQDRDVEYMFLMCDGSIEVAEYDRIGSKERAARDLLADGGDSLPTREVFLKEALDLRRLLDQQD